MFGSNILDVAIGLALIFLLLSLVASGVREAVEAVIKSRAVELERGIRTLLNDPRGEHVARAFYEHPLIYSLYHDEFEPAERRFRGRNLPSYIPARNFAVAILDMVTRGVNTGVYATQQTAPVLSIEGLRSSVRRLPSPFVQRAVLSAIDNAHGDVKAVQKNLEAWYDSAMDRVSGSYKRRTQLWLFVIGLCTAAALNVNTITIADYLSHNEQARAALAQRASTILNDSSYRKLVQDSAQVSQAAARAVYADLQSLSLPIGWDLPQPPERGIPFYLKHVVGLLLTSFAVMLGAPFWFDLLNKVMVIRSTVKPHEKSPEEGSEDRQAKGKKDTESAAAEGAALGAAAGAAAAAAGGQQAADGPAEPVSVARTPEPPFEPHTWANNKEEGIL